MSISQKGKKFGFVVLGAVGLSVVIFGISRSYLGRLSVQEKKLKNNYGLTIENLKIEQTKKGDGRVVEKGQRVTIHFISRIQNSPEDREIDNSYRRVPMVFIAGFNQVLTGLDEGVIGMKVGEKRRLTIPPGLAFGPRGNGSDIPSNATMIYDVELLKIEEIP